MSDVTETRHGPAGGAASRAAIGLVPIFSERSAGVPGPCVELRGTVRVGRDAAAEVAIDDSQMSRLHAAVSLSATGVDVMDLGSRNGTFVNGARVGQRAFPAPLGALIRCGRTLLRVVADISPFRARGFITTGELIGGPGIVELLDLVRSVAPLPHAALVEGETGTGKELVVQALHKVSGRRGELVAINCSALPADLIESELFGHARGAFSGSDRQRAGLFRVADHGTLVLDELGELPLPAQAKLLRAMESREVRPVGEDRPVAVDVRVVGSTNARLDQLVETGRFRRDLFHRIAVWRIGLPALRERMEDVPLLALHFLGGESMLISVEAMERLVLWHWPGNVRELRNVIATAVARARAARRDAIALEHLPALQAPATPPAPAGAVAGTEDAALRARIETALMLREGNVSHVAQDLGLGRPWLYQVLKRLDIDPASYRKRK